MYYKEVEISILDNIVVVNVSCTPQTPKEEVMRRAYQMALKECERKLAAMG